MPIQFSIKYSWAAICCFGSGFLVKDLKGVKKALAIIVELIKG
jgi:hypothetical protein